MGLNFTLSFKATNILNARLKQTYTFLNESYIYRQYQTGRSFEIGMRYTFKH